MPVLLAGHSVFEGRHSPNLRTALLGRHPPRQAAAIALDSAERLDKRLAEFSPALLEAIYAHTQRCVKIEDDGANACAIVRLV